MLCVLFSYTWSLPRPPVLRRNIMKNIFYENIYTCHEHIICCWGCLCISSCNHLFFTISVFLTPNLSNSLVLKFSVTFPTVVTFFQTLFSGLFALSHVLQSHLLCAPAPYPLFLTCMNVILLQLAQCYCLYDVHPTQELWYLICLRAPYSIDVIQRLSKLDFSTLLSP